MLVELWKKNRSVYSYIEFYYIDERNEDFLWIDMEVYFLGDFIYWYYYLLFVYVFVVGFMKSL